MRRFLTFIVVVGVLAAGGFYVGKKFAPCSAPMMALASHGVPVGGQCDAQPAQAAKPAVETAQEVPPPAVTVVTAAARPFVDRLFVSGTLVAREEAMVAAQIDGLTIVEVDAEDGDTVKSGQVLARLDRTQLDALIAGNDAAIQRADAAIEQAKSQIDQAQAQVSFATDDYNRALKLGGQVIAVSTIDQRHTTLLTAQAQFDAAQHALNVAKADRLSRAADRKELEVRIARTEVKAPVDGLVSRRTARLGATAAGAGDPLFRIIENGAIDLEADVPEQSMAKLANGTTASLIVPGFADPISGKVRLISQEIDKVSRTGKVRIALDPATPARVGAFASGEVSIAKSNGLGVPSSAIERDGRTTSLLVVKDNVVQERKVTLGITEGDTVEVKDGLQPGDLVVARAAAFLRPGDRVRPVAATTALNN